uniref:PHD-type domain-containing protein n=2 Tax=Davidia involucrata TaxID=16924 RepID=A0A5B7AX25_DAVIN
MKRELAFALEAQSQLTSSLGRTRASKIQSSELNGVSEDISSKRLKSFAENESVSIDRSQEKLETNVLMDQSGEKKVRVRQCNGIAVYKRNKRFNSANLEVEQKDSVVETVIEDEPKCNLATPVSQDENKCELAEASVKEESNDGIEKRMVNEGGSEGVPIVVDESNEVKNDVPVEALRRFTRSALKPKVEPVEGLVSVNGVLDAGENESVLKGEEDETGGVSALGTPTKKLELKMSNKSALTKIPTTVKELFETGMLEGYSVIYNGGNKGSALRGTIKGVGILCSCTLCKGSRVIKPCQFEIHACKTYRRAAQYICLENGKSLLQVMKACEKSPVDTLEETIRSVIGSLPIRESMICQNCKGSFPATFAAKVGQLCELCMDSKNSQTSPTDTTGTNARSKPVLILKKSSRIAKMGISSENKSQEKKTKKWSTKLALVPKSSGSPSVRISSQNKCHGKTTKNSPRSILVPKSLGSASVHISSQNKSQGKIIKRSLRLALDPKSSGSASVHISSPKTSQGKITKKSSKLALIPRFSKSASLSSSPQNKSRWKITKKDLGFHKLVFEEDGLPDGSEVAYYSRGKKLLEGYKKGLGIFCRCCQSEISPSQFEAHAGWASRKKPYGNIYTSNGVSLHELAVSLLKGRKHPAKDNDDLCIICADGGNLLLCDGCPRAFHIECASLTSVPRGKWYCKYCQNMFQRDKFVEHNANAVAAGRVSGVDPIEQITKRCIRIVKNPEEAEVIACVLCRGYDFSKSGFGPRTVILCDQCEKEYHVGCLKKHKMADLKELPKGKWFCCMDCSRIYSALQNLLFRGEEKLPDFLLDVIKKKHVDKGLDGVTDFDVRWRLLSGKIASSETRLLLSRAVAIFHDCFDPIVDSATGRDFIPSMVYGRNIRGQDFGGMYCAVLTVNSSVVSAGILRVFGREVAELPLVATSNGNQGKGYFQLLFSCIEKLLAFLNVRSLVLPAADEAESIWTDKFGFEKMPQDQLRNYRRTCWQIVTFKGTSMLQKVVPKCRIINQDVAGFDVPMGSS